MVKQMSNDWKPADTLANRLRLVRATMGITQRDLADMTGVSIGKIQGIEDGRSPRNESVTLKQISMALGLDRDWLVDGGPLNDESPSGGGPEGQNRPSAEAGPKPAKRESSDYMTAGSTETNIIPIFGQPERKAA